jgi:hypothetical protein
MVTLHRVELNSNKVVVRSGYDAVFNFGFFDMSDDRHAALYLASAEGCSHW